MATTVTPYLSYPGNCREAFTFYAQALGGRIQAMMSYDDLPPPPPGAPAPAEGCGAGPMPGGPGILHACLVLPGGAMLMAGDTPPGVPFDGVRGVMVAVQYDTVDEARRAFDALAAGGQVTMPLAPSFWAQVFGMVTDRYGIAWAINGAPIDDRT